MGERAVWLLSEGLVARELGNEARAAEPTRALDPQVKGLGELAGRTGELFGAGNDSLEQPLTHDLG